MGINQRVTVIAIVVLIFVLKSILSSSTPPFSTGQALSWNLDEEQFERIKVRNGSKLRLWFKGPKYPSSTITWYKDGKKIKNVTSRLKIKQSSLVILKLEEDDSGEYACYKQNQHGEVWKNYTLTVTTDPLITKPVIQSPLNQTVAYLDDVKFQCKVIMNSTSTNIQWFKHYQVNGSYTNEDGVPYVHVIQQSRLNHSSEILYIKNVTYEDAGWYTCLVTNAVGRAYQSAWLTVTVPSTLAKRTIFGMLILRT
ncbi:fibroblast growth factor receptor 4-like [Saccostrea cucullata]|uniref:fibroblast growth factor receptor 4-like n=1 Tax=Saccostrea cuccullata TaxID=36930 RepID=UPI002ED4D822